MHDGVEMGKGTNFMGTKFTGQCNLGIISGLIVLFVLSRLAQVAMSL